MPILISDLAWLTIRNRNRICNRNRIGNQRKKTKKEKKTGVHNRKSAFGPRPVPDGSGLSKRKNAPQR